MGDAWGEAQFADAALYIADRDMLADMLRKSSQADLSDTDAEKLLKSYISENEKVGSSMEAKPRTVHVVGGDYFSQSEYEAVRNNGDNMDTINELRRVAEQFTIQGDIVSIEQIKKGYINLTYQVQTLSEHGNIHKYILLPLTHPNPYSSF